MRWQATISAFDMTQLRSCLLRADRDEHAAFVFAGLSRGAGCARLLVREVWPVADHEFVPSDRGAYRQIVPRAVARAARHAARTGTCIIWAHSHPGSGDYAGLSDDDRASNARAHPTLMQFTDGRPVGALVVGENAVAGEIWSPDSEPQPLELIRALGPSLSDWRPAPASDGVFDERRARQILMFGEHGQARLRRMVVAVVGVGGGGSILVQQLAHLGVGTIIVIDHDVVSESNLSRIVGATRADVGRLKVDVARAHVRRIDKDVTVVRVAGDITYVDDALMIKDCDFAFLATDTASARHAFDLVCHQYMIPGIQIGAKVVPNPGDTVNIVTMNRAVLLGEPCLHCAQCIPANELHREQQTPDEHRAQAYADDAEIHEPSVITLNTAAAGVAATEFMLVATGLAREPSGHRAYYPLDHAMRRRKVSANSSCVYCGVESSLSCASRGDLWPLQLRPGASPALMRARRSRWRRLVDWLSRASPE